jgi:hypothetical protein
MHIFLYSSRTGIQPPCERHIVSYTQQAKSTEATGRRCCFRQCSGREGTRTRREKLLCIVPSINHRGRHRFLLFVPLFLVGTRSCSMRRRFPTPSKVVTRSAMTSVILSSRILCAITRFDCRRLTTVAKW